MSMYLPAMSGKNLSKRRRGSVDVDGLAALVAFVGSQGVILAGKTSPRSCFLKKSSKLLTSALLGESFSA